MFRHNQNRQSAMRAVYPGKQGRAKEAVPRIEKEGGADEISAGWRADAGGR